MQALVLLNDQSFVEAAGGLAIRGIREGGLDPTASIGRAFRLALGRSPDETELGILLELRSSEASRFRNRPEDAKQLLMAAQVPIPADVDPAGLAAEVVVRHPPPPPPHSPPSRHAAEPPFPGRPKAKGHTF